MLAVGVTLGSAYLLTESLITDEVDLIIDTELKSLEDKFARSGVPGVTDEINLRIDSWGRIGAVYMLADANFERIAGNVTDWPFEGMPAARTGCTARRSAPCPAATCSWSEPTSRRGGASP